MTNVGYRIKKPRHRGEEAGRLQNERRRLKWRNTTVGFSEAQGKVLREVTDRYNLSLAEVLDRVFAAYVPKHFTYEGRPLRWPRPHRNRRTWRLHENKANASERTDFQVYGFLLSHEQSAVLAYALEQLGISRSGQSSLIEAAFVAEFPGLFHRKFPHKKRKHVIDLPLVDDGSDTA